MVSTYSLVLFVLALIAIIFFFLWSHYSKMKRQLLNTLYKAIALAYASWIIPLIIMYFVDVDNHRVNFILDCLMQPGGALCSPFFFCIAAVFINGKEKMEKWMKFLFIIPVLTILVSWTNSLHHLYYVKFDIIRDNIRFGPYIYVSGLFNYVVLITALVYVFRFCIKNNASLYWKQGMFFIVSGLCPLLVNIYATFSGKDIPITATPLSFMVTIILNGFAIFRLHMLDITPIANQHILNAISDSYLVLDDNGRIVEFNMSFNEKFSKSYGIKAGLYLRDCIKNDTTNQGVIYGILAAVDSSRQGGTHISYEQAVSFMNEDSTKKKYYVVDVSPLEINGVISGFVIIFKDVTQLRDSMRRLQASQERMMEQERFAFLGQMIGGLAHNLKTPIMSVSGCIAAAEALIAECEDSLDDDEVTNEDYMEIYTEIRDWFSKVKESTAYMSDIITAIKGQATSMSIDEQITFTIDEMLKRSRLLMRHELLNSGCRLIVTYDTSEEISLRGDINNLVQVIGNLINNSIFAQQNVPGGGEIEICVSHDEEHLKITVLDRGEGISEKVKSKLFRAMITSKGTKGTGLGLYVSNAVIRSKFNGHMWCENREGGGSIFGISIPLDMVHIKKSVSI